MNDRMNSRVFSLFLLLGSLLLLLSCGGGGENGGNGDPVAVASEEGGALKGRIRIQDSEQELVLSDHRYHEIPAVKQWLDEQEAGGEKSKPFGRFSADGRYMLQIQRGLDCEKGDGLGSSSDGVYCFTVFDETYSVQGKFSRLVDYHYEGDEENMATMTGVSLSPDGQYIAITRKIPRLEKWRLHIWALNGESVSASETSTTKKMGQPTWLADGSLVLTMDNDIVRTDPYSTLPTSTIKSFPAGDEARPRWVSASHDGKQLAFLRGAKELWVMNLDGSNPRQVVKLSTTYDGWTLDPGGAWSPDDTWIAFRVTSPNVPAVNPIDPDTNQPLPLGEVNALLLAVPSNASNAIATTTTGLSERSPEVISIQSYNEYGLGNLFFSSLNNLKHLVWLPE